MDLFPFSTSELQTVRSEAAEDTLQSWCGVQAPSLYEGNLLQSLRKGGKVGLSWCGVQAPSLYEGNLLQSLRKGGRVGLYTMRGFHNELRAKLPGGALH